MPEMEDRAQPLLRACINDDRAHGKVDPTGLDAVSQLEPDDLKFLTAFDEAFGNALCSGRLAAPLDPCIPLHMLPPGTDMAVTASILSEFDWSAVKRSELIFGGKVLGAYREWTRQQPRLVVFWDIDGTLGEYSCWGESQPWCTRPIAQPLLTHLCARYPEIQHGLLSNRPQSSIESCFFSDSGALRDLSPHFAKERCHTSSCLLSPSLEGPTNAEIVTAKGSLVKMMRRRFPDRSFWLIDDLPIDPTLGLSVGSCRPPDILAAAARLLCRFED